MKKLLSVALLGATLATSAMSDGVALIIGNEDYRRINDLRRGDLVYTTRTALERSGMTVIAARDAGRDTVFEALTAFGERAQEGDRLLVALSGRFAHTNSETYFLPVDTTTMPLAEMPGKALPLSVVLTYLETFPGNAVLALATDNRTGKFSELVRHGIGDVEVPQGVTLVRTFPRTLTDYITQTLTQPGVAITNVPSKDLRLSGFVGKAQVFTPAPLPDPEPDTASQPSQQDGVATSRVQDLLAWRRADSANSVAAYEAYVRAFPRGQFVRMAENRIRALTDTPEARSERAEQALDLNRDQRRQIQRNLSLLGYNTRGIDGIFGNGTRAAIVGWQKANNLGQTGFLDRDQIVRLDEQAQRRAAELEAEAEARRQAQLARDRAFWSETGAIGDEAGYRIYLERFPDGEFSELARARLNDIEREKRRATDARDRQLWDEASIVNSRQAYADYLTISPNGAFRDEAIARIEAIDEAERAASTNSRAAREEEALNLNSTTRRILESRLDRLGLKPGKVDGTFDDNTRRAIRRYQQARQLPETGYLNENVVVRLLADSVRSVLR